MTSEALVIMIGLACGVTDSAPKHMSREQRIDFFENKVQCVTVLTDCMVGPNGVIKAETWDKCIKSWEKKNK